MMGKPRTSSSMGRAGAACRLAALSCEPRAFCSPHIEAHREMLVEGENGGLGLWCPKKSVVTITSYDKCG